MSPQERLAFHRQQLKQKLGLVAQGKVFSTGIEALLDDSDISDICGRGGIEDTRRVQTNVSALVHVYLCAVLMNNVSSSIGLLFHILPVRSFLYVTQAHGSDGVECTTGDECQRKEQSKEKGKACCQEEFKGEQLVKVHV